MRTATRHITLCSRPHFAHTPKMDPTMKIARHDLPIEFDSLPPSQDSGKEDALSAMSESLFACVCVCVSDIRE